MFVSVIHLHEAHNWLIGKRLDGGVSNDEKKPVVNSYNMACYSK